MNSRGTEGTEGTEGRVRGWEVGGITKGNVFVSALTVRPKTVIIPEREPAVRDSWIVG
jgi:hypothetical protein